MMNYDDYLSIIKHNDDLYTMERILNRYELYFVKFTPTSTALRFYAIIDDNVVFSIRFYKIMECKFLVNTNNIANRPNQGEIKQLLSILNIVGVDNFPFISFNTIKELSAEAYKITTSDVLNQVK